MVRRRVLAVVLLHGRVGAGLPWCGDRLVVVEERRRWAWRKIPRMRLRLRRAERRRRRRAAGERVRRVRRRAALHVRLVVGRVRVVVAVHHGRNRRWEQGREPERRALHVRDGRVGWATRQIEPVGHDPLVRLCERRLAL